MKNSLIALVIYLLMMPVGYAQSVSAALDRQRIAQNESVQLTVESDNARIGSPDWSLLERDFDVGGYATNRQISIVNGQPSTRIQYSVMLRPLKTGVLQIPALRIGNTRTNPLQLVVEQRGSSSANTASSTFDPYDVQPDTATDQPVYMESTVDSTTAYVQQNIGLTVKFYYSGGWADGALTQKDPTNASITRVGEDKNFTRVINGRRYSVVERYYSIIPEKSGKVTIPAAYFEGRVIDNDLYRRVFGGGSQQDVRINSKAITLDVKSVPANASQPWLPLHQYQLRYLNSPQSLNSGQADTITLQADVDGALATQLPQLELTAENAQVFPEQPKIEEVFEQGRPNVRITREFSIVPNANVDAVTISVPSVQWWDVQTNQPRQTTVQNLVLPVGNAVPLPRSQSAQSQGNASQGYEQNNQSLPAPANSESAEQAGGLNYWAIISAIFALLWLGTLIWGASNRQKRGNLTSGGAKQYPENTDAHESNARSEPSQALRLLKNALEVGDMQQFEEALVASSRSAHTLEEVKQELANTNQVKAIVALQQARWGRGDLNAAKELLRQAFKQGPVWKNVKKSEKEILPPLYPES